MEHVARDMLQSALKLAEGLDVQGLLAVEFFITAKGTVIFNEMAPRPHNSGHLTIELARASQFALAILAACNRDITATGICNDDTIRPLIQVPIRPGYMLNRLGHECCVANAPPGAIVYDHDYGKKESRLGRKMGHVTVELPTQ
jgi:5-(carboxyamino)imidazole ribonucleotide synthase